MTTAMTPVARGQRLRMTVLGASGGCGQWLVRLAAARGHAVTAVIRAGSRASFDGIERVVRGDVTDSATLDEAVAGADVVLSALGLRRASLCPWSRLLSPPDLTARVTGELVESMRRHGVSRLLVISAGGVGDSRALTRFPIRAMIDAGNVGVAYRDLARMEARLAASHLDWTAVRPVTLCGGPPTGAVGEVSAYGPASRVRRADVAAFMLDVAEGGRPVRNRTVLLGATR